MDSESRNNSVFSSCDEIVRFISRYLRRRVELDLVIDAYPGAKGARVVDIGCDNGRNLVFGTKMGLEMYGVDLSTSAVEMAKTWLAKKIGPEEAGKRVIASDICQLLWPDKYFAHAISDGALDSVPFEVAQEGINEISRVLQPGGYFYCNLISGDETGRDPNFNGEEVVNTAHENRVIKSYFNRTKIRRLIEPQFEIISCKLHQISDPVLNERSGRWHVISRRR
jgi:ubiquinone/menaquinone biosynthesis C-methylase UbiE